MKYISNYQRKTGRNQHVDRWDLETLGSSTDFAQTLFVYNLQLKPEALPGHVAASSENFKQHSELSVARETQTFH